MQIASARKAEGVTRTIAAAAVAALIAPGVGASAAPTERLAAPDFPPIAVEERDGRLTGPFPDLMREIARRIGHSGEMEVLPLARLNDIAVAQPNILFAVGRNPWRELSYQWVFCFGTDHLAIISHPRAPIRRIEEATADKTIAVMIGSTMETLAMVTGIGTTVSVRSDELALEMVAAKRVNGWLAYAGSALHLIEKTHRRETDFVFSEPVRPMRYYLGTGLTTPVETVQRWRTAFDSLRADGTYERILAPYAPKVLPCASAD